MNSNLDRASSDLSDVFDHIDAHRQAFIDRLIDYVRRPSISAHGLGIAEVAEFIEGVLNDLDFNARVMPTAGWPMVYGERVGIADAPTVLLYGHYDVQPPDPLDQWISPPFEPTIRDGRLYARGVGDNKGQHFAQILALESLLAVRGGLPCNVKVILEGEEEIGSPQMHAFAAANRELLRADLVITSDGPVDESGRSTINFGNRGVVSFELRATGANRDLHSGNWGGVVPNPIWTLVHLLQSMKNDRGVVTIDGFYDNVRALDGLEAEALSRLDVDLPEVMRSLNLQRLDRPEERGFFERLMSWPTFTINGFHGGYGGPGSKTVLPHEASVKCDIRLVDAQTANEIYEKVAAHVSRHAPEVELIRQGSMDPSKTPIDSPFTAPISRALEVVHGESPILEPSAGGSLPNYVFTKLLNMPAFGVPYANPDESNHAPNENLELDRFIDGIKTGAAMITFIGAVHQ
ncbi:MAG TPA: M20/M25/M40 family metallo-hydrolase [Nitrolancea sp.]|nr:M20/M25/M40 family metallo-hydrolase [Nitrolancea sp.]